MQTPLEKKRATYLQFYKDGIYDGILNQKQTLIKTFLHIIREVFMMDWRLENILLNMVLII